MVCASLGAWYCAKDLHVRFWLGEAPYLSLAALAVSLSLMLTVVCYQAWVNGQREREAFFRQINPKHQGAMYVLPLWILRLTFLLLCCGGWVAAGFAAVTLLSARELGESLGSGCSQGATTGSIERVYLEISSFRNQCHEEEADLAKPADQCAGFAEAFPEPAPYAMYLKLLELESGCAGFCAPGHGSLFARQGSGRGRPTCAAYLGSYVWQVALAAAVPAAVLGVGLAFFGGALLTNEDM